MNRLNKMINQRELQLMLKDYVFIIFGIIIYAIGFTAFILPEKLVSGGLTGAASLVFYAFKVSPAITIWSANIALLLISFRALNQRFVIRTVIGVSLLSFFIGIFQQVFAFYPMITPGDDRFMHVVIGAILCGGGLALVFAHNGSTGGTDILVAMINKYSNMSLGRAMQLIDIMVICSSYFLFHSLEVIVYGIVFTMLATYTMDYVVNGTRQTVQFLIISKHYESMADAINQRMNRGVTVLHGQGWYSKQDVKVIMVLCRKYESQYLFNLIKSIDPAAMVSQSFCHGVFGEGFDKIK